MQEQATAKYPGWNRAVRAPSPALPPGSCDSQFHIFEDPAKYPPKPDALYDPPDGLFADYRQAMRSMGFQRGVIVHAMPYDADHRLLIDTLKTNPDRKDIRAIGIIKDSVSDAELDLLNSLGVCGARINIGKYYKQENSSDSVRRAIERAKELGWHIRLHIAGPHIMEYGDIFSSIKDVTYCVDHMGHVPFAEGLQGETFRWLLDRLKHHGWWLMLSNGARLSAMDEGWDDAVPFGKAYVEAAPDRLIWGSDWPHVRWRKPRMPSDAELVELLYRYAGNDTALVRKIMVDNPQRLHGFT